LKHFLHGIIHDIFLLIFFINISISNVGTNITTHYNSTASTATYALDISYVQAYLLWELMKKNKKNWV